MNHSCRLSRLRNIYKFYEIKQPGLHVQINVIIMLQRIDNKDQHSVDTENKIVPE